MFSFEGTRQGTGQILSGRTQEKGLFLLSSVGRARDTVTYRKELLQDKQKTGLIFVQTS